MKIRFLALILIFSLGLPVFNQALPSLKNTGTWLASYTKKINLTNVGIAATNLGCFGLEMCNNLHNKQELQRLITNLPITRDAFRHYSFISSILERTGIPFESRAIFNQNQVISKLVEAQEKLSLWDLPVTKAVLLGTAGYFAFKYIKNSFFTTKK